MELPAFVLYNICYGSVRTLSEFVLAMSTNIKLHSRNVKAVLGRYGRLAGQTGWVFLPRFASVCIGWKMVGQVHVSGLSYGWVSGLPHADVGDVCRCCDNVLVFSNIQ